MIRIQVCVYVSLLHIGLPQSISAKQWWHKGVSGANRGDYGAIVRICILLRNSKTLQKERQGSKPFYQKTTRKMRTHNWKGVWKRPHIPFFFVFLSTWRSGVEKRGVSFLKAGLFYQMVLVYVLDTWVLALLDGWNLFICRYFFALAEIIYSYLSNKRRVGKGLEKYIKIINEGSGSSKGILYYYILNKEVKSLK